MNIQPKSLVILGSLVILTLVCNPANSQSNTDTSVFMLPQECHDYNWLRKLKVGTAPFVDARLLDQIFVGYKFQLDQIEIDINDDIVRAFASGNLMYGSSDGGSYPIGAIGLDDALSESNNEKSFAERLKRGHADALKKEWTIIGKQEVISDIRGDEIVCWTSNTWNVPPELQRLIEDELSGNVKDNG